jgi:hypothetical protein
VGGGYALIGRNGIPRCVQVIFNSTQSEVF